MRLGDEGLEEEKKIIISYHRIKGLIMNPRKKWTNIKIKIDKNHELL